MLFIVPETKDTKENRIHFFLLSSSEFSRGGILSKETVRSMLPPLPEELIIVHSLSSFAHPFI